MNGISIAAGTESVSAAHPAVHGSDNREGEATPAAPAASSHHADRSATAGAQQITAKDKPAPAASQSENKSQTEPGRKAETAVGGPSAAAPSPAQVGGIAAATGAMKDPAQAVSGYAGAGHGRGGAGGGGGGGADAAGSSVESGDSGGTDGTAADSEEQKEPAEPAETAEKEGNGTADKGDAGLGDPDAGGGTPEPAEAPASPPEGAGAAGELQGCTGAPDCSASEGAEGGTAQPKAGAVMPTEPADAVDAKAPSADEDAELPSPTKLAPASGEGGGSGGDGGALPNKPAPPLLQIPQSDPESALGALSGLSPGQILGSLGAVQGAVRKSVGKERGELAAAAPTAESSADAGAAPREGSATARAGEAPVPAAKPVVKAAEKAEKPTPELRPVPIPMHNLAASAAPQLRGTAEGKLDPGDVAQMKAALDGLSARDPGLQQMHGGETPQVALDGSADPQQAEQQRAEVERTVAAAHAAAQKDAAQPMGENDIHATVPRETLRAEVGGGGEGGGEGGAGGAPGGDENGEAIDIVAEQEFGQETRAAVAQSQADVMVQRQQHAQQVGQERARSQQEVAQLQREGAQEQSQQRTQAQREVQQSRADWTREHAQLLTQSRTDSQRLTQSGRQEIHEQQSRADRDAQQHIQQGETDAAKARAEGEAEAARERQEGKKESGGFFGWLASKAKAFFDRVKQAVQRAIEKARQVVKVAIEAAQRLARAVIEAARKAIVAVIRRIGDALIALGDRLLAGFPALRDRFRAAIQRRVQQAEAAVNALAERLKQRVQAALSKLGQALEQALGRLEKGLLSVTSWLNQQVQGIIAKARAMAQTLGGFLVLIKDVASSPGQWLRNLSAAVMDGIRNHLWKAFQSAVKEWFRSKLESLLGLGTMVWDLLKKGGMGLAEIGTMVWDGLKAAIPGIVIGIVVEKLVQLIIPAAGTVMVIIEGLKAAWATVSRILQALGRFMEFLKAVKSGNAGPLFGQTVAAAGVAVIDFVSNWLVSKLRAKASQIGGKLKEFAKRIAARAKNAAKKVGGHIRAGVDRVRQGAGRMRDRLFGRRPGRPGRPGAQQRPEKPQERLQKAVAAIQPKVATMIRGRASKMRIRATLFYLRVKHRLTKLYIENSSKTSFRVVAVVNPMAQIAEGVEIDRDELLLYLREVAQEVKNHQDVKNGVGNITRQDVPIGNGSHRPEITVPENTPLPSALNYANGMEQRQWGNVDRLIFEGDAEANILRKQGKGKNFNQKIIDKSQNRALKYAEIADKFKNEDPRAVSSAIKSWVLYRKVPEGFDAQAIGELATLLHVQESLRNDATIATGPMIVDLMGKKDADGNQLSVENALKMSPMHPRGAVKVSQKVNEYLDKQKNPSSQGISKRKPSKSVEAAMEQEVQLVKAWIRTMDLTFPEKSSMEEKIRLIKKEIHERIHKYYGLTANG